MNLSNDPPLAGDLETVVGTASALHITEFDVFRLAYENWFGCPAESQVLDTEFSRYMNQAIAPLWVRSFTRRVRQSALKGRLDLREYGIEPLPSGTRRSTLMGGLSLTLILIVVAALIYFAVPAAEKAAALACRFPPCY
ncbi:MAG: hypothetical protein H6969_03065 [Gammaproteobacteria bacterium]|nr:hypothetical protein [Gammaproteobacteria bacterium]